MLRQAGISQCTLLLPQSCPVLLLLTPLSPHSSTLLLLLTLLLLPLLLAPPLMLLQPHLHALLLRQLRINLLALSRRRRGRRTTPRHLPLHQLGKRALLVRRQRPIRTRLRHLAISADADDEVGALDSGEAVGDGDGRVGALQHAM